MSVKVGDEVKAYGHVHYGFEDGIVGTYRGHTEDSTTNWPGYHLVAVPGKGDRVFREVKPVDSRSELEVYKQDVLLPALERKNKQHNWCGEYEEFLKEVNLERKLPELPIGKNALIEDTDGNVWRKNNVGVDRWYFTTVNAAGLAQAPKRTNELARIYKRTIFEGE